MYEMHELSSLSSSSLWGGELHIKSTLSLIGGGGGYRKREGFITQLLTIPKKIEEPNLTHKEALSQKCTFTWPDHMLYIYGTAKCNCEIKELEIIEHSYVA